MPNTLTASPRSTRTRRPPTELVKVRLRTLIRNPSKVTRSPTRINMFEASILRLFERLNFKKRGNRASQKCDGHNVEKDLPCIDGAGKYGEPEQERCDSHGLCGISSHSVFPPYLEYRISLAHLSLNELPRKNSYHSGLTHGGHRTIESVPAIELHPHY